MGGDAHHETGPTTTCCLSQHGLENQVIFELLDVRERFQAPVIRRHYPKWPRKPNLKMHPRVRCG